MKRRGIFMVLVLVLAAFPGQVRGLATQPGGSLERFGIAASASALALRGAPANGAGPARTMLPSTSCDSTGTVYYVDGTNGNDEWDGTTPATAWRTVHKANQELQPGDTVYIRGGTYLVGDPIGYPTASTEKQGIRPRNSGTEGNPIAYCNYNDEVVNFVGDSDKCFAVDLNSDYGPSRSYIVVKGLNFYYFNKFLWILRSSHNEIAYCTFQGTYQRSDNLREWRGSTVYRNSQYNHIHHCTFADYGDFYGQDDRGVLFELGNENVNDDFTAYNLIEDNHFYHGAHHVLGISGSYNVIRNNYIHNEEWWEDGSGGIWGNRILFFAGPTGSNDRNLVEGNRIAFGGETAEPDQVGGSGGTLATSYNIIRRNLYYQTLLYAIFFRIYPGMTSSYNHIYHNVFYHNGYYTTDPPKPNYSLEFSHAIYFAVSGNDEYTYQYIHDNSIKNNIFYDNHNYYSKTVPIIRRGQFWGGYPPVANQIIENNWEEAGDPLFVHDESPLDPFGDQPDFHLRPGSPCINAGTFLTAITSPDGSGTQFQVEDAGYFMDGWGIIEGDVIQLEGSTAQAQITHVDYDANTITVDQAISWRQGAGVALAYHGAAPDLGAYEFVPELVLHGAPADQAIHLTWSVNITLPVTSTWQIDYEGPAGDQTPPISGIVSPTRSYSLTGLTNYAWYTVTLDAMLGSTPLLSDTVRVMPTDIAVYLPLVRRTR